MSARDAIFARLRAGAGHGVEHPGAFDAPARSADWRTFAAALAAAGGETLGPVGRATLAGHVSRRIDHWGGGRAVAQPAAAAWLGAGPWQAAAASAAPDSFADVAVGIACASLCVAENGAVALPARLVPQRSLLFLCERLIVLAPARCVVPDMHAAAVEARGDAGTGPCFQWIAGPSKTADIEQHLVVGAHGPRALLVVGVDDPPGEPEPAAG